MLRDSQIDLCGQVDFTRTDAMPLLERDTVRREVELFLAAKLTERAEQVLARAKRKA